MRVLTRKAISLPLGSRNLVRLPVLRGGDWESAAKQEGECILDWRAKRYDDADASVGKRYAPLLHLPPGLPAWDVYGGSFAGIRRERLLFVSGAECLTSLQFNDLILAGVLLGYRIVCANLVWATHPQGGASSMIQ